MISRYPHNPVGLLFFTISVSVHPAPLMAILGGQGRRTGYEIVTGIFSVFFLVSTTGSLSLFGLQGPGSGGQSFSFFLRPNIAIIVLLSGLKCSSKSAYNYFIFIFRRVI